MPPDPARRHHLPAAFDARAIRILLVGCGGSGAQMLMGLAALDTALRAISSRSLAGGETADRAPRLYRRTG